jgi:hypothetical protein
MYSPQRFVPAMILMFLSISVYRIPPGPHPSLSLLRKKSKKGTVSLTTRQALPSPPPTRGCILGRIWDKNLKTFALCYSQSSSPIIRNASKGGKPNRKPYHLMVSEIYTKQSTYEENSSLFINSVL